MRTKKTKNKRKKEAQKVVSDEGFFWNYWGVQRGRILLIIGLYCTVLYVAT
jgi:hypothetical protein